LHHAVNAHVARGEAHDRRPFIIVSSVAETWRFSALTAGNVLSEGLLDDRMSIFMVLLVIIAIAALAPVLGAGTRTPEPLPRRRRLTRSKPWEALRPVPDDRRVPDRFPLDRAR
jgi:hypothetical protein